MRSSNSSRIPGKSRNRVKPLNLSSRDPKKECAVAASSVQTSKKSVLISDRVDNIQHVEKFLRPETDIATLKENGSVYVVAARCRDSAGKRRMIKVINPTLTRYLRLLGITVDNKDDFDRMPLPWYSTNFKR